MSKRKNRPRYRIYTHYKRNKYRLATWMQRRCKVCGRFIGLNRNFLCKSCNIKRHEQGNLERYQVYHYSLETIRDVINIPIPGYLCNSLRSYM